jgi:hypothetical protein
MDVATLAYLLVFLVSVVLAVMRRSDVYVLTAVLALIPLVGGYIG